MAMKTVKSTIVPWPELVRVVRRVDAGAAILLTAAIGRAPLVLAQAFIDHEAARNRQLAQRAGNEALRRVSRDSATRSA